MKKIIFLLLSLFILFSCGKETVKSDPNIDLAKANGKYTFVGFVATWCPHCKEEMPVYEDFYKANKQNVNMQLIVVDGKKFDGYTIPQDTTNPITYEQITNEKCEYVPSYVIYDENKKIVDKKCGSKLSKEDLETKLLKNTNYSTGSTNNLNNNSEKMKNDFQTKGFQNGDIGVIMTTTNGKIELKLFPNEAPKTVLNFIALSQKGYYNNLTFHRVIKDFMIQGGDPLGTGMGGESIYKKEFEDEFSPSLSNIRGSLSMANAGANTNGSQFFINQKDNTFLDNKHTVFGQVITGLDNVDKIAQTKTDKNDRPEKEVKIIKIEVVKYDNNSLKPYEFKFEDELKKIEDLKNKKKEADKNREVKSGDKISVNYIGKITKTGEEFDSSYKRGTPLEFQVGAKQMIPGFENGVLGMKIGDKKTLKLKAKDAYGEYDEKNIQETKISDLKSFTDAGIKLEVGTKLPTMYGEFEIKEVGKDTVKIDMNHFLAGKDLTFEVELVGFNN